MFQYTDILQHLCIKTRRWLNCLLSMHSYFCLHFPYSNISVVCYTKFFLFLHTVIVTTQCFITWIWPEWHDNKWNLWVLIHGNFPMTMYWNMKIAPPMKIRNWITVFRKTAIETYMCFSTLRFCQICVLKQGDWGTTMFQYTAIKDFHKILK